jgi:Secretion system C-terminal sorting domain/GEVED domain
MNKIFKLIIAFWFSLINLHCFAQINEFENFNTCSNPYSITNYGATCNKWTVQHDFLGQGSNIGVGGIDGYSACSGAGSSAYHRLYLTSYGIFSNLAVTGMVHTNQSLGKTSGLPVTLSFIAKAIKFGNGNTAASGDIAYHIAFYNHAVTNGPFGYYDEYSVIEDFEFNGVAGCQPHSVTFTPPKGIELGILISTKIKTWGTAAVNTDIWSVIDDVNVFQQACTTNPTSLGLAISNDSICSGNSVGLSVQNLSTVGNYTFDWQKSTDGTFNIGVQTFSTNSVNAIDTNVLQTTYYRCNVTCPTTTVNALTATKEANIKNPAFCYCVPTFYYRQPVENLNNIFIPGTGFSKTFYNIQFEQEPPLKQLNLGSPSGFIRAGNTYTLNTRVGTSSSYECHCSNIIAWIDWDNNLSFDSTEAICNPIAVAYSMNSYNYAIPFTVPINASAGLHRLRILYQDASGAFNYNTPCSHYHYGDAVDVDLAVVNCTTTQNIGILGASKTIVCKGKESNLFLSSSSPASFGHYYYWQSAYDSLFTQQVDTLNTFLRSITINPDTTKYYRCITKCIDDNVVQISNAIKINVRPNEECYCASSYPFFTCSSMPLSNVELLYFNTSNILPVSPSCSNDGYKLIKPINAKQPPLIEPASSYDLKITNASNTTSYYNAWLDGNVNDIFEPSEALMSTFSIAALSTQSVSFQAPYTNLISSPTVLRIRGAKSNFTTSDVCGIDIGGLDGMVNDYAVYLDYCTGKPNAGITLSNKDSICKNEAVTLSLQNDLIGTYGYQWQQADDITFTNNVINLDTINPNTYTININGQPNKFYRCMVFCPNSSEFNYSTPLLISKNSNLKCYCYSAHITPCTNNSIVGINILGSMLNITLGCNGDSNNYKYNFPGSTFASFDVSSIYTLQIYGDDEPNQYVAAWLDYNFDGKFSAPELVGVTSNIGSYGTGNIVFVMPGIAQVGTTRLRFISATSIPNLIDACATNSGGTKGVTQDFDVALTGTPLSIKLNVNGFVEKNNALLNWDEVDGVDKYEIQKLEENQFKSIAFWHTENYTTPLTSSKNIYRIVAHLFNGTTIISNTISLHSLFTNKEFIVYPNPSSGILSMEFKSYPLIQKEISVVDVTGKIVFNKTIKENFLEVDLQYLKPGIYYAVAIIAGEKQIKKITLLN